MTQALLSSLPPSDLRGRRVLVRLDLNVPLDDQGRITDRTRIRASVPTVRHLGDGGARVTLLSHLGRPGGRPEAGSSLAPVAEALGEELGRTVGFCGDLAGDEALAVVHALEPGEVVLLENTRFHPGETSDAPELARALARYGELYVNDAFGAAHRAHASTHGVAREVRAAGGRAVAGFLLERELRFLGAALNDPARPFVAILGGAKISGKIEVLEALLSRVDRLLVGGAMANTFFLALGLEVGDSLVEPDSVALARELMERAGERLVLPVDCRVAPALEPGADPRDSPRSGVRPGERIGDIGPDSVALFRGELLGARTVVWNGPMGVFELAPFAAGTLALARAVAEATDEGATTIIGGGDSAAAVEAAGVTARVSHVSTGGGASLEFLAGASLPGVEALSASHEEGE